MTPLVVVLVMAGALLIAISSAGAIGAPTIPVQLAYGQTDNETSSYQTYENETASIRIQYPANWTAEEKNLEPDEVIRIFPHDFLDERISPVRLDIYDISLSPSSNLSYLSKDFETYIKTSPDNRFINSTNTTISGLPAHSTLYYDFGIGQSSKVLDTMTLFDNRLFNLHFFAKSDSFDKYLPQVHKMIDSFQLLGNVTK